MSYDLTSLSKYIPDGSVIASGVGDDSVSPFSYSEWLEQSKGTTDTTKDRTVEYNKYIKAWNSYVLEKKTPYQRTERYKLLIKNIALNYTTSEEKRFLTNIDYNNKRHVAAATTFFAEKIKELALYYADARQSIRQASTRSGATGSIKTIERLIYNKIPEILSERLILGEQILTNTVGTDKNVVNVEQLYQIDENVDDFIPVEFDPDMFSDMQLAIENLLSECLPVLELSNDVLLTISSTPEISDENISLLNYENFDNYQKLEENLNLYNLKEYVPQLIGADMFILSGGNVTELYRGSNKWRDFYNRTEPLTQKQTTNVNLKTQGQLGNIFMPSNIGMLTYYSHQPAISHVKQQDEIAIIPDPNKYGTKGLIAHNEDVTWLKASAANDGLAGDIVDANRIPRFYSYRSEGESSLHSFSGMSRSYDPTGFFSGYQNEDWANSDVFARPAANIYDIDSRQETLLTGHNRMTRWVSDIFGNQYAVYKQSDPKPPRVYAFGESQDDFVTNNVCQIIDGGDTLKRRSRLWDEGVSYKIYEGGRRWDVDPKVEQQINMTPFEDLRQTIRIRKPDGTFESVLEEHNSWDFQPNDERTELVLKRITYHGFKKKGMEPVYDTQAYGGLFTDITCGQIDPASRECVIRDNYAFGTFSDGLTSLNGVEYFISGTQPLTATTDAFEQYFNTGYDDQLLFDDTPTLSGTEVLVNEDVDGGLFSDESCFDGETAQYTFEVEDTSEYYDRILNISKTQLTEIEYGEPQEQTQYSLQNQSGTIYFRSYNDVNIKPLHEILTELQINTGESVNTDRVRLIQQVREGKVIDMNMYYDVLYLQTENFVYVEKIKFDDITGVLLKSDYESVLLRSDSSACDMFIKPLYNNEIHQLMIGQTFSSTIDDKLYVHPLIYMIELNTMSVAQILPGDETTRDEYQLSGDLSRFQVEKIDTPILCYNSTIDLYTLSYSCKLSGGDDVCYGFCISDFEKSPTGYRVIELTMNHTDVVKRKLVDRKPWENKVLSKNIRFNPDDISAPTDDDKTYTLSLSSIIQQVFDGYQLDLTFVNGTLPVDSDGPKINQIIYDPGDGSDFTYLTRLIETGFEPINFEIGDLPDQSDLHDPRKYDIQHQYTFTDSNINVYTPTLTAVYANHKKLILNMNLEVEPYTIESGFDDIRLIDTKTYTDLTGHSKQLLVTETLNPRYISHTVITKSVYTNENVVGLVDGEQYRGKYHKMSDGTLMTGEFHHPASQTIYETA